MHDFWRLVNLFLSLVGFLITGGVLIYRGGSLLIVVVRAIIVFVVLYVVQNLFGSILVATVGKDPASDKTPNPVTGPDQSQALRN